MDVLLCGLFLLLVDWMHVFVELNSSIGELCGITNTNLQKSNNEKIKTMEQKGNDNEKYRRLGCEEGCHSLKTSLDPTRGADSITTQDTSERKRTSQWEVLMRKFSEAHRKECKAVSLDIPRVKRAEKMFPTGSSYTGTWDVLGMSGYGTYKFPNGVIYEGEFDDGTFHRYGELRYPSGAVLKGKWKRGEMTERTLIFPDGLHYSEANWPYCMMPDRRFTIEINNGLQPAGRSNLTAEQPTRDIPEGFYDTGDGFYNPKDKAVHSANDVTRIIREPSVREQKWIMNNCRTNPMRPLGPQPDLYEEWSKPQVEPKPDEPYPHPQYSYGILSTKPHVVTEDKESVPESRSSHWRARYQAAELAEANSSTTLHYF